MPFLPLAPGRPAAAGGGRARAAPAGPGRRTAHDDEQVGGACLRPRYGMHFGRREKEVERRFRFSNICPLDLKRDVGEIEPQKRAFLLY